MKLRFHLKFKDIVVILLAILLCIFLGYLAVTITKWWEWIFIAAIIVCIGLQARTYLLER
ncbi:MAG: hypothetical protein IJO94_04000 [Firmicutes bacterium]|nr:hypothetical protein [Bacillota bacterium]MBQ4092681.1 hypothetical protein [Bacillota bacterium]MBQ6810551.1 hypothetical protein [Bacillota bacterium]